MSLATGANADLHPDAGRKAAGDWLPWAWCNLFRNPFGELSREERIELAVVDIDAIAERVGRRFAAVQLIGACGRGKTTRMLVLSRAMLDSSYVYLPEDGPCPVIPEGNPLLIDEAQRLPRSVRRRVFQAGLPLVLATHRDLCRPLRRAGYEVHTERIGTTNNGALVCKLMNRRIAASRLGPGPVPRLSLGEAEELVARFGSNIRAMEAYLYERVQGQVFQDRDPTGFPVSPGSCSKEIRHGEMRFID